MNKRKAVVAGLSLLVMSAIGFSATSMMNSKGPMGMMKGKNMMKGKGMMGMSMVRHQFVMINGIGAGYASKKNPLVATKNNLRSGKILYENNCLNCHGESGTGDGLAGKNINPPPANIASFSKMPMASDRYLFWTIAEGGVPVKTAMPPFKGSLQEKEIWKIIIYLRAM